METLHSLLFFFRTGSGEKTLIITFFILIVCEWIIGKIKRPGIHDLKDSISNFLIGGISFLTDFIFSMMALPVLDFLFRHFRLFEFTQDTIPVLTLLFVLVDVTEYWYHRLSHEINVLWSAHIVHHQSEFFNLTVGLRTSLFVPFFNIFFYLVFPVLGFDPVNVLVILFIQGIYQLLLHTKLIGKLGFLEYIFVTPSAHRVHHGKNEIYLDRNYGKVFIFWDFLFGTYQRETETVEFGLKTPMEKPGILFSVFEPYKRLLRLFMRAKSNEIRRALIFRKPDVAQQIHEEDKAVNMECD